MKPQQFLIYTILLIGTFALSLILTSEFVWRNGEKKLEVIVTSPDSSKIIKIDSLSRVLLEQKVERKVNEDDTIMKYINSLYDKHMRIMNIILTVFMFLLGGGYLKTLYDKKSIEEMVEKIEKENDNRLNGFQNRIKEFKKKFNNIEKSIDNKIGDLNKKLEDYKQESTDCCSESKRQIDNIKKMIELSTAEPDTQSAIRKFCNEILVEIRSVSEKNNILGLQKVINNDKIKLYFEFADSFNDLKDALNELVNRKEADKKARIYAFFAQYTISEYDERKSTAKALEALQKDDNYKELETTLNFVVKSLKEDYPEDDDLWNNK